MPSEHRPRPARVPPESRPKNLHMKKKTQGLRPKIHKNCNISCATPRLLAPPSPPSQIFHIFARRAVPPLTVITNAADVAFEKMPSKNLWLCNEHRRAQAQRHT